MKSAINWWQVSADRLTDQLFPVCLALKQVSQHSEIFMPGSAGFLMWPVTEIIFGNEMA